MKTKNIEEAINRIKDFKNLLVEIGLNVTLKHEDEEITLKRSDLILALEHIEELEKLPNKINEKIEEYKKSRKIYKRALDVIKINERIEALEDLFWEEN